MHDDALSSLPWHLDSYLLLDGVSVEALPRKIYEWSDSPDCEVLYLETPWAELSDVSPHLVKLENENDPVLAAFISNLSDEWGYLLFSSAPRASVLKHLRWLTCVQPQHGAPVLLRLADPAVMHALLALEKHSDTTKLYGPIEYIYTPDAMTEGGHQHQRFGSHAALDYSKPYALDEAEHETLGAVSFRQGVLALSKHMQRYFPNYGAEVPSHERLGRLQNLASDAYEKGFCSSRELTLFANIIGYLGENFLDEHEDLARLLNEATEQTPIQRLESVAQVAQQRVALRLRRTI
ncbi:DUF4123 domain-containing protein [Pseudomonas sp. 5Ae-yellow]|uniref:DUF4123 domain-containing protein n=1 Tax=Pseudomonas sp. 5Ae-yellow TaxID=2759848 RepID=UPI0015F5DE3E|nr:DUF4123 domain-containing protein [Pseudomonas sp. 5Ae-yellow]MBA6421848.1 DUF4123 domain-containing protein [Pseudomonas sp. 5Ae-yellow]|tara:strand:- start:2007 stop:2885 length:879 start_codon:yes stop_codon:yes gene_type:complete